MVTSSATVSGICSAGYPSKAKWPNSLGDFENFTSILLVSLALGCIFLLLGHPDISAATTTNINKRSISSVYNAGVINIHFIDITHRRVQSLICRIKRTFLPCRQSPLKGSAFGMKFQFWPVVICQLRKSGIHMFLSIFMSKEWSARSNAFF